MTFAIEQQVVGLDVPVDEVQIVDVFDGKSSLCHVELGHLFGQRVLLHEQRHRVASWKKLHHKVEIFLCFDDFIDLNNVRVMKLFEDFNFATDAFDIFFVFDL